MSNPIGQARAVSRRRQRQLWRRTFGRHNATPDGPTPDPDGDDVDAVLARITRRLNTNGTS